MEAPVLDRESSEYIIQTYLDYLRDERRLSQHSVQAASFDLMHLQTILVLPSAHSPASASEEARSMYLALKRQLGLLFAEGRSASTIARMASSWRQFFAWLVVKGIYQDNPAKHLKTPRRSKLLPKVLSPDAAHGLLRETDADVQEPGGSAGLPMVLAELLYGCGLRISEALGLDEPRHARSTGWIDWHGRNVHVTGKGGKSRMVPLGEKAHLALQQWLVTLAARKSAPEETDEPQPLFVNQRGRRLSARSAQGMIARLAKDQGLERHVHPHMLRHSFASHVLQSSGDLRGVQELLGHSSLASTQIYTALDDQYLAKVYDAAHPRAKK